MLRRLTFTNFKTWEKADIEFGQVTGLFGTNSSGKTSLIQFLLMLKQTKEATDRALSLELNGNYVKLGSFGDVVFGHDDKLSIEWSLSFEQVDDLVIVDPAQKRGRRGLPFHTNPGPSLDGSRPSEVLCLSRPSQDLLSKRLVSLRSRSGVRKCTRQHLLPRSAARLSTTGLSLGEIEATRCRPQRGESDRCYPGRN